MPHKSKHQQPREKVASGKHARPSTSQRPGTERTRDEQREGGGPRYAGGEWQVADERGEGRYGHARTDDADPSELAPDEAESQHDDSDLLGVAEPDLATAERERERAREREIESSGQQAGMRRGEKPRKPTSRVRK
jgi:hypothetical protein